jgi:hypothetical protein
MHEFVLFVDFLRVCLGCKPSQTFLMDIYPQRLITSDTNINSQIKLMTVDQQWVSNILTNNRRFINIHIINIVYQIDSFALTGVCWLDDPHILFAFVLFQLLVMIIKISELLWQNVCVRRKVKRCFAKFLLHTNSVIAHPVFSCDFIC